MHFVTLVTSRCGAELYYGVKSRSTPMTAAFKYLSRKYLSEFADTLFERQMQHAAHQIDAGLHLFPRHKI
jgi:hypothetical protein